MANHDQDGNGDRDPVAALVGLMLLIFVMLVGVLVFAGFIALLQSICA